jgi:hypothetical protein
MQSITKPPYFNQFYYDSDNGNGNGCGYGYGRGNF